MALGSVLAQLRDWRMLLNLAGDGADLRLADFVAREVGRMVEDRDTPELRSVLQFRCPSRKRTPYPGQQKPGDHRTHPCRRERSLCQA